MKGFFFFQVETFIYDLFMLAENNVPTLGLSDSFGHVMYNEPYGPKEKKKAALARVMILASFTCWTHYFATSRHTVGT